MVARNRSSERGTAVELPKRKQNRLKNFDYSTPGAYFITICTNKRQNLFWRDDAADRQTARDVPLTPCGAFVEKCIRKIPTHYPSVTVDHYVVMPDHVHLLLQIHTNADGRPMVAPTISMIVRQMKGYVSKVFGTGIWQKGFYDHVIRNDVDYREIWRYIDENPQKLLIYKDQIGCPDDGRHL